MKRFSCDCGQEIYFDNLFCGACGSPLGFDPVSQTLISLGHETTTPNSQKFRFCEHRDHALQCNWLIPIESPDKQCLSCATTRQIPILDNPDNWRRWHTLEAAKRRLFYGLLVQKLPIGSAHQLPLVFDFLEDQRSNPAVSLEHVLSGHSQGVITLNAAEADGSYREAAREAMNEPYRTLLGHFRHESGHYYWDLLIKDSQHYPGFQQYFGDESRDYNHCLQTYYLAGAPDNWQQDFISAYASAHPLEDWAETWAHYLLMIETLETALSYGVIDRIDGDRDFDKWFEEWLQLVRVLNALNRSTGQPDAYPFVVSESVQQKLKFIHAVVNQYQS